MFESSINRRKFQKGLDCDRQRALRRDSELSLRRKQREEHLQKRRKKLLSSSSSNLNNNGNNQESIPLIQDIPKYVGMVFNTQSISIQLEGTRSIRKLLSIERDPPTIRISRSGVIPKIISFMHGTSNKNASPQIIQQLQFESAWILTNIAASSSDLVRQIVQNGVIEAFVYLFRNTSSPEIADQAIWGLGNIAGDNKRFRDRILNTGFLNDCIKNIFDLNEEMQENIVWTISNLFRYKEPLFRVCDIHQICRVLCKLLRDSRNDAIIGDCLWAFHYISSNPGHGIINHLVLETGIINQCIRFLEREKCKYEIALHQMESIQKRQNISYYYTNKQTTEGIKLNNIKKEALLKMNDKIYRPCLRLIGNVLSEPDDLTQAVLDANYLDIIEP